MKTLNMLSISSGKDSTALLLLALERGVENLYPVFADTGNEHRLVYDYLDYLEQVLKLKIRKVRADFSEQIARKRERIPEQWSKAGVPDSVIDMAVSALVPSGVPFLDLCIWKGRFPSSQAAFCTEELKIAPITDQIVWPMLREYERVNSWQGIRWDESPRRANYVETEGIEPDAFRVFAYRPILAWTAQQVFEFHRKYRVEPNPLYKLGQGRVGCMPCVNVRKNELKEIAARFPEEIDRLERWEAAVSAASRRQSATFFCATNDPTVRSEDDINFLEHGIRRMVDWAGTSNGGRQRDFIASDAEPALCSSIYGLCE